MIGREQLPQVHCESGHTWTVGELPMPVAAFCALLQRAQCPECDSTKVFLGAAPRALSGRSANARRARVEWLCVHRELWQDLPDEIFTITDERRNAALSQRRSDIVRRLKDAALLAPGTAAIDCNIWEWIRAARGLKWDPEGKKWIAKR